MQSNQGVAPNTMANTQVSEQVLSIQNAITHLSNVCQDIGERISAILLPPSDPTQNAKPASEAPPVTVPLAQELARMAAHIRSIAAGVEDVIGRVQL